MFHSELFDNIMASRNSLLLKTLNFVDRATSLDQLLPILRHLSLLDAKMIIKQSLREMHRDPKNQDKINKICAASCPMDHILSKDAIQTVVSFIPFQSSIKCVNKNINTLCQKNATLPITGNQTDWAAVVMGKSKELKRISTHFQQHVHRMKAEIQQQMLLSKKDLDFAIKYGESTNEAIGYCTSCFKEVNREELFECDNSNCQSTECNNCLIQCTNGCDAVVCHRRCDMDDTGLCVKCVESKQMALCESHMFYRTPTKEESFSKLISDFNNRRSF